RNHLEFGRGIDEFGIGFGGAADNQRVGVSDGGQSFVALHLAEGCNAQSVGLAQCIQRRLIDIIGNEYVVGHKQWSPVELALLLYNDAMHYTPRNSSRPDSTSSSMAGCISPMCAIRKVLPLILP